MQPLAKEREGETQKNAPPHLHMTMHAHPLTGPKLRVLCAILHCF